MDPHARDRYQALCRTLRARPLADAVVSPEYLQVLHLLLPVSPGVRPLDALGEPGGELRALVEEILSDCDRASGVAGFAPPPADRLGGRPDEPPTPVLHPRDDLMTAGGFRLVEELGRGGLGTVYRAEAVNIPGAPPIAIKVLARAGLTRQTIGALSALQEAQAGYGLNSPNLVRVVSCGRSNLGAYVAMEYVPGLSLARWLARVAPGGLGQRQAVAAVLVVAGAVDAAYSSEKRLVHRDIKPSNILGAVAVGSGDAAPGAALDVEKLKLGDFGIAQHAGVVSDGAGVPVYGTLGYMPPEQLAGEPNARVTGAADVFALGMTLVELATGRLPFSDPERDELRRLARALGGPEVTRDGLTGLRDRYAGLLDPDKLTAKVTDPHLRAICRKALAGDPAGRYPDAGALRTDLKRWADDRPTEGAGYRYTRWERVRLLVRRSRRKGPSAERDQSTIQGAAFLLFAPFSLLSGAFCTLAIVRGAERDGACLVATLFLAAVVLGTGAGLLWLTRNGQVVWQILGSFFALAVGVEILRFRIIPDHGPLSAAILLLVGLALTVMGWFSRLWWPLRILGPGMMIESAVLARPFQDTAWLPFTPLVLGANYTLVFVLLGLRRIQAARRPSADGDDR
ncbi:MAG: serine/threonine protein kinase [Gemmataceae bacterium]|nr:serine/threonine protein kinase [Gemmataceae bacterium]